jgi:hypothetical protein
MIELVEIGAVVWKRTHIQTLVFVYVYLEDIDNSGVL